MDRHPVLGAHFVELVDAHHPPVRQHHRSAFEEELAGVWVLDDRGRQTSSRGALAGRVHRNRCRLLDELEELGLGCRGVAQHQDVDVPAQARPVGKLLPRAAHQLAAEGLLDVVVPEDGGRDGALHLREEVWVRRHLVELALLLGREVGVCHPPAHSGGLGNADDAQVGLAHGPRVCAQLPWLPRPRLDGVDAGRGNYGAWHDAPDKVAIEGDHDVPRHLARRHLLRKLLNLELLDVDVR
mmetsp:Transcript_19716/g.45706  ORF Transcript_19716/g.45706 Transcript_19716/m.45706 type:complete len:240 (-) Transcript_19716:708-1427(-)